MNVSYKLLILIFLFQFSYSIAADVNSSDKELDEFCSEVLNLEHQIRMEPMVIRSGACYVPEFLTAEGKMKKFREKYGNVNFWHLVKLCRCREELKELKQAKEE